MSIKTRSSESLFCFLLLLTIPLSALAQLSEKEKKEKEAERRQLIERKTYVLVEEIAGGAPGLKLPENRSFVLVAAADLLWDHDETRARNLFWDALNTLPLMTARNDAEGTAKLSKKEKDQRLADYFAVFNLRQDILQRVAGHDPQLAMDMLRASRQAPAEPPAEWVRGGFSLPDDRVLEQQIAAQAAARDPRMALQVARESLAKGFSFQLIVLLQRLNLKDVETGKKFAGEVISKLRGNNIARDQPASSIAISLLMMSRKPDEEKAIKQSAASPGRPLDLDEEQRGELVEMITNAVISEPANGNLLYGLSDILPEIKEFAPERVALVQKKLATFNQTLNKEQRLAEEFNLLNRNGTPEEVLTLSATASDDARLMMQQQAVAMAVTAGRADSFRDYINTEVKDESRRKSLLDALDTAQINRAVYENDLKEVQKLLPTIRRKEERARVMSEMAIALEKKGDHEEALSLLNQAQTLIKTGFESETQTNALLALVGAYALVEPARAFAIIERTVDRANDEMAKLLLLDKFLSTGVVKRGEIRMQNSGMIPIDFAVFKYGKSVAALANADFDRTAAVADRFERIELRLMARLLLAQALLRRDDEPTKSNAQ